MIVESEPPVERYLILATPVALSLLLFLVWPRNGRHAGNPENSDEPKQALAVGDSSGQSDRGAMKTEPPPTVAAPVSVVTNQSNDFERFVRESTEAANVPVAFYGKVVDQDSNALQNVSVDLQVIEERVDDYPQHNERIRPLQRQTDAEGKFEAVESSLKGRLVLVSMLTKEGYE